MQSLETHISLPPGVLSKAVTREFFRRVFEEYRWFKPKRYGFALLEEQLDPSRIDYDALLSFYEELSSVTVAARTDRDFVLVHPAKPSVPPYTGAILWVTSAVEARKASWRANHLRQVTELMRLVKAPYAYSALGAELQRKQWRRVPCADGFGQEEVANVRDYSEGLAGLFWRNFFGPPFVRLFGERLSSLPPDARHDLGDGIVLVQPYALPTQAGTPEGAARERELISHLGSECFYDHARHVKPTRLPELPPADPR